MGWRRAALAAVMMITTCFTQSQAAADIKPASENGAGFPYVWFEVPDAYTSLDAVRTNNLDGCIDKCLGNPECLRLGGNMDICVIEKKSPQAKDAHVASLVRSTFGGIMEYRVDPENSVALVFPVPELLCFLATYAGVNNFETCKRQCEADLRCLWTSWISSTGTCELSQACPNSRRYYGVRRMSGDICSDCSPEAFKTLDSEKSLNREDPSPPGDSPEGDESSGDEDSSTNLDDSYDSSSRRRDVLQYQ